MEKKKKLKKVLLILVISLLIITLIITQTVTHILINREFQRGGKSRYTANYRYSDIADEIPRRPVEFMSGKNLLHGYVYGNGGKGLVVFAHGIGSCHENYLDIVRYFAENDWTVFAYDSTGCGESDGDGTRGLPQSALDLDCALTYIEGDPELSAMKKCLVGHSWGGYAVTAVLNFDHEVSAVASFSGYAVPIDEMVEFAQGMMGKKAALLRPFIYADMLTKFGKYTGMTAVDGINRTDIPIMVIHGDNDDVISYDHSGIIAKQAKISNPNVRFVTVDEGSGSNDHNHIFQSRAAFEYRSELNEELNAIKAEYGEESPPDEVYDDFFAKIDKERANELNAELMAQVSEMFEKS